MTNLRPRISSLREAHEKQSPIAFAETMRKELPGVLECLEELLKCAEHYRGMQYTMDTPWGMKPALGCSPYMANEALRRCEEIMGEKREFTPEIPGS